MFAYPALWAVLGAIFVLAIAPQPSTTSGQEQLVATSATPENDGLVAPTIHGRDLQMRTNNANLICSRAFGAAELRLQDIERKSDAGRLTPLEAEVRVDTAWKQAYRQIRNEAEGLADRAYDEPFGDWRQMMSSLSVLYNSAVLEAPSSDAASEAEDWDELLKTRQQAQAIAARLRQFGCLTTDEPTGPST